MQAIPPLTPISRFLELAHASLDEDLPTQECINELIAVSNTLPRRSKERLDSNTLLVLLTARCTLHNCTQQWLDSAPESRDLKHKKVEAINHSIQQITSNSDMEEHYPIELANYIHDAQDVLTLFRSIENKELEKADHLAHPFTISAGHIQANRNIILLIQQIYEVELHPTKRLLLQKISNLYIEIEQAMIEKITRIAQRVIFSIHNPINLIASIELLSSLHDITATCSDSPESIEAQIFMRILFENSVTIEELGLNQGNMNITFIYSPQGMA